MTHIAANNNAPRRVKSASHPSAPAPALAVPAATAGIETRSRSKSSWSAKAGRISIGDGRYWARTSDPQLVDWERAFHGR